MGATESERMAPVSAGTGVRVGGLDTLLRRRRYLVDRRYQMGAGLLVGGIAFALLVLLNFSLYYASRGPASVLSAEGPGLWRAQDRTQLLLAAAGSVVFLVGVVLVTILESHKTAGAAYRIGRGLERLRVGERSVQVRLRRDDHLQELAETVNDLAASLRDKETQEIERLEAIVAQAEVLPPDRALDTLISELRGVTATRRRSLD